MMMVSLENPTNILLISVSLDRSIWVGIDLIKKILSLEPLDAGLFFHPISDCSQPLFFQNIPYITYSPTRSHPPPISNGGVYFVVDACLTKRSLLNSGKIKAGLTKEMAMAIKQKP